MNIEKIIKASEKPEIYTKGTAVMWTDDYISTQLLETHLSQATDLASRKESTIDSTLDWILDKVPGKSLEILDIGCGPGLYTEKLAERGHRVTGLDFSENSIRYAKASANKKKLNITYLNQNYLDLNAEDKYDLITLIFTDFCVLLPKQRDTLLKKVYRALKPGGKFIFDVLNKNYQCDKSGEKSWEAVSGGFWKQNPYITLTESFYYETEEVGLTQHIVMNEAEEISIYRFWVHTLTPKELETLLSENQFTSAVFFDSVLPDSILYRSEEVTFCIASKE